MKVRETVIFESVEHHNIHQVPARARPGQSVSMTSVNVMHLELEYLASFV